MSLRRIDTRIPMTGKQAARPKREPVKCRPKEEWWLTKGELAGVKRMVDLREASEKRRVRHTLLTKDAEPGPCWIRHPKGRELWCRVCGAFVKQITKYGACGRCRNDGNDGQFLPT